MSSTTSSPITTIPVTSFVPSVTPSINEDIFEFEDKVPSERLDERFTNDKIIMALIIIASIIGFILIVLIITYVVRNRKPTSSTPVSIQGRR